jgi:hypothetical protein
MCTLYDNLCTFIIASCRICLRMRNVLGKSCREKNANFMFSNIFHKLYHMRDTVHKYDTPRQTTVYNVIRCMHFACWISKAVDTHPEYVIRIAFSLQQWLCKHTSLLCYMFIACLLIMLLNVFFLIN